MAENEAPNVKGMTRQELNDYAGELGIADAAAMANKDEVIAAIEAADAGKSDDAVPDESATDSDAPAADAGTASSTDEVTAARFRVLKAFTLSDGRTRMPGEDFDPAEVDDFPTRRTTQMVEQQYLRPID